MIRRGTSCSEHARSDLFRRAVAEAGRGLPTLEPGAPLPAGTGLNRRSFLATAAGALLTVYGAGRLDLSALDEGIAQAAAQGATTDPVLVSIFLDWGIDSLSVLYPGADPAYRRLRPRLRLNPAAGTPFSEDTRLSWHPKAGPLATLHGEGKLSIAPALGYGDPDQSHFTSRHYTRSEPPTRTPGLGGLAATSTRRAPKTTRCRDSRSTTSCNPCSQA